MMMLYIVLIVMLAVMLLFPAAAYLYDKKSLLSPGFLSILILSALGTFSLYGIAGSAGALQHYRLLKTVQEMGGIDAIMKKIEKRVAEHPDDAEGKEILRRLKNNKM